VRLARHDGHIEIVVSDTGSGIAPEFTPYVFERFRQGETGTTRQYGGLGLGLSIVRHLVELHGGTVSAESAGVGKGATFRVLLPVRADVRPTENSSAAEAAGEIVTAGALDGLRVLVVDDDPQARELLAAILENAGAEARLVGATRDALDLLHGWWPDVLLSDVEMPDDDGYSLMEQVSALSQPDHPPVTAVAVTAHSRPEDRQRAVASGFQWHLPKPVEPSELVAVIASLRQRSRTGSSPIPAARLHQG
jgi:CheY-like chemotaxis protein